MLSHGSTLTHRKKFATLSGGCAPEASTLPPVTVSRIFSAKLTTKFCHISALMNENFRPSKALVDLCYKGHIVTANMIKSGNS